jgi:hypothetical protein
VKNQKKAPADVMGALLRLELHGFPHPVAELAATVGGYRAGCFAATSNRARRELLSPEGGWLKLHRKNPKQLKSSAKQDLFQSSVPDGGCRYLYIKWLVAGLYRQGYRMVDAG